MIFRFLKWIFFGFFMQVFGTIIVGGLFLYFMLGGGEGIKSTAIGWWNKVVTSTVQVNIEKDGQTTQYKINEHSN